jgi:predicted amidohydrolase
MQAPGSALPESRVVQWLQQWAKQLGAMIGGSVALSTTEGAVNRFLLVEPQGKVHFYDKRHLFRMAGEHNYYVAGKRREIVEWRGWRILPQVCYDLRFPVYSRNRQDYDLALYVANWPAPRSRHWQTLLAARAIENQAYVAGCNRVGTDDNGHYYSGDSLIINPQGEELARAEPGSAMIIDAELSLEALQDYRETFPAWRDADTYLLHD